MKTNNIFINDLNSIYAINNINEITELIKNRNNLPLSDKELQKATKDLYQAVNIIINNNDIKKVNETSIKRIIDLCLYISNENTRRFKTVVHRLKDEIKNRPNDNYESMTKEELIALLRNK